jgi:hypothetical protein
MNMKSKVSVVFLLASMLLCLGFESWAAEQKFEDGKLYVDVNRRFTNWDNPIHSEFIVNGQTVDIFSSGTYAKIDQYIKEGWNEITIKSSPQEPANAENCLEFSIGPMHVSQKDATKFVMAPILWYFDNGTDWDFKNGKYIHALGPDVKEVTLTYHLYWAGNAFDELPVKKGDYVLNVTRQFTNWNSPVIVSVLVNGTAFTSFLGARRQLNITSLLKHGKNELKIVSHRVKDSIGDNDMKCSIQGPAEWSVAERKFTFKPITTFSAMQGWKKNKTTGQLVSIGDPNAEMIGRTIEFMINEQLEQQTPESEKSKLQEPEDKKPDVNDKYRSTQTTQENDKGQMIASSL